MHMVMGGWEQSKATSQGSPWQSPCWLPLFLQEVRGKLCGCLMEKHGRVGNSQCKSLEVGP